MTTRQNCTKSTTHCAMSKHSKQIYKAYRTTKLFIKLNFGAELATETINYRQMYNYESLKIRGTQMKIKNEKTR